MNAPDKKPASPPPPPIGAKGPPPGVPTLQTGAPANGASTQVSDDKPDEGGASEDAKAANRSKLFIVVGEVHEFPTAAKAEAFLNQPNGPKQFTVIRGHKIESKQKVTLR